MKKYLDCIDVNFNIKKKKLNILLFRKKFFSSSMLSFFLKKKGIKGEEGEKKFFCRDRKNQFVIFY
jgi:hypothetical protein